MAVGVAVLALLTATAVLLMRPADPLADTRASALAAVKVRTAAVTSYDAATLDSDVAAVLKTAVEPFATSYTEATRELRTTLQTTKAKAAGSVVAAGLESVSQDRAVAVVAVDQVIQAAGQQPRRERNRLRMTLVRPRDTWLVERVERL